MIVLVCIIKNNTSLQAKEKYVGRGVSKVFNEDGSIIPNDKIIPYIEGESLFSLVVTSSMNLVKDFFDNRKKIGLEGVPLYFNVSAHTVLHKDFLSIFKEFIESVGIKEGDFGIEVTETAELNNLSLASLRLSSIKNLGFQYR